MVVERIYTINLRRAFINVARWRRAKRAIQEVRRFVKRHTKCEEVKIDPKVSEFVWQRGAKNPPPKVTVKVVFDEKTRKEARVFLYNPEEEIKTLAEVQEEEKEGEQSKKEEKVEQQKEEKK